MENLGLDQTWFRMGQTGELHAVPAPARRVPLAQTTTNARIVRVVHTAPREKPRRRSSSVVRANCKRQLVVWVPVCCVTNLKVNDISGLTIQSHLHDFTWSHERRIYISAIAESAAASGGRKAIAWPTKTPTVKSSCNCGAAVLEYLGTASSSNDGGSE